MHLLWVHFYTDRFRVVVSMQWIDDICRLLTAVLTIAAGHSLPRKTYFILFITTFIFSLVGPPGIEPGTYRL